MSRPVKNLIAQSYRNRFGHCDGAVVIAFSGIAAGPNNELRNKLAESGFRIMVVKNTLARIAAEDTALQGVSEVLDGACALVYTTDPEGSVVNVARTLMDVKKEMDFIEILGAVMEQSLFTDAKQVEALSKYPTREEAIGKLAGVLLGPGSMLGKIATSPGANVAGAIKGTAGKVAALVKAVEMKQSA